MRPLIFLVLVITWTPTFPLAAPQSWSPLWALSADTRKQVMSDDPVVFNHDVDNPHNLPKKGSILTSSDSDDYHVREPQCQLMKDEATKAAEHFCFLSSNVLIPLNEIFKYQMVYACLWQRDLYDNQVMFELCLAGVQEHPWRRWNIDYIENMLWLNDYRERVPEARTTKTGGHLPLLDPLWGKNAHHGEYKKV